MQYLNLYVYRNIIFSNAKKDLYIICTSDSVCHGFDVGVVNPCSYCFNKVKDGLYRKKVCILYSLLPLFSQKKREKKNNTISEMPIHCQPIRRRATSKMLSNHNRNDLYGIQ